MPHPLKRKGLFHQQPAGHPACHQDKRPAQGARPRLRGDHASAQRLTDFYDEYLSVLDMDAYTHRYDFPPKFLLLDTLHRRHRDDTPVVVGYGKDELYVRTTEDVDLTEVAETAAETVGDAGIDVTALRVGKLSFLSGRREESVDAVLDAVVDQLES